MRLYFFVIFVFILAILTSCENSSGPLVCTGLSEPAIEVEVTDRTTGRYIAKDAEGTITEESFSDSLSNFDVTQREPVLIVRSLAAGFDRPGTYDVTIQLKGYESFSRTNVEVPAGDCGPDTQVLQARLRPSD